MSAVITFVIVFVMYSHAYQYLWEAHVINVMPGYWYAIVGLLGLVAWVFASRKRGSASEYNAVSHRHNQRVLFSWAMAFAAVALFSYFSSAKEPQQLRALKTVIICVGMLGVFLGTFKGAREIRAGRMAIAAVVLVSIVNNVLDFTGIYAFSNAEGRAAGFYVNPNIAGLYLVLGMILTTSMLPRRYRLYYCLLVGMAVVITFSRASVLMWLVGMFGLLQMKLFRLSRRTLTVMWVGIGMLLLVVQFRANIVQMFGLDAYLSEGARQRLHLNFQTDASIHGRLDAAIKSWELFKQAWWTGHGLGAHEVWKTLVQPHNMFLLIGMELGLIGLFIYSAMFVVLWRMGGGISRTFAAALFVGSLFSHNLLDYSAAIWLAYALLAGITAAQEIAVGRNQLSAPVRGHATYSKPATAAGRTGAGRISDHRQLHRPGHNRH